ncbi:MAG TPA: cache domain-containing protein [Thermodesulfobacteriota bacterium]|nr:cache domain-containing protein [Thermodesulfobacteriota bacterium]
MVFSKSKRNMAVDKRPVLSLEKKKAIKEKAVLESALAPKLKFGLTAKVVTLMLIVSLVPLLIFAGITMKQTNDRLRNDTERLMALMGLDLVSNVDEWIDKNVRVLRALATMPDIVSMIRERQEPFLKAVGKEYPWMYLVFTVGPDGMNVARQDDKPLLDYADRDYYKAIMGGKDIAWQTTIGKTSKKPALIMAVPIKRGDTTIGVMAMAATIEDLSKLVATWKQGQTGFAFLVDEKGRVVSHQNEDYVTQQTNLSEYPLITAFKKGQKGMIYFSDDGTPRVGYAKETKYGWTLAMQQDTKETFKALRQTETFTYLLLGITAFVVIVIAWLLGRAIGKPIKQLTQVAERISVGDMEVAINIKSRDEIGNLAEAISRMQDSLRLAIERFRKRQ